MALRFRITYHSTADLLADIAQQVSRRGLLVRVAIASAERGAPVELQIVTPVGTIALAAAVLQLLPGLGVAVELDPAAFDPLAAQARAAPIASDVPVRHEQADDAPPPPRTATTQATAQAQQTAQKIQLALHGDKNQRMAILREQNKSLHNYVLRNPGLQLDEILFIAKQPTSSAELLSQIGARREWGERPEIAIALVRNPKTPVPLAIRLLDFVTASELRGLAKQQSGREPIQRAARKKLLG